MLFGKKQEIKREDIEKLDDYINLFSEFSSYLDLREWRLSLFPFDKEKILNDGLAFLKLLKKYRNNLKQFKKFVRNLGDLSPIFYDDIDIYFSEKFRNAIENCICSLYLFQEDSVIEDKEKYKREFANLINEKDPENFKTIDIISNHKRIMESELKETKYYLDLIKEVR